MERLVKDMSEEEINKIFKDSMERAEELMKDDKGFREFRGGEEHKNESLGSYLDEFLQSFNEGVTK